MRRTEATYVTITMLMTGLFVFAAPAMAERPPDAGNGGGGEVVTPDYGDLIQLYRDADGVPYLTADGCWQPLPSDSCPIECLTFAVDGMNDAPDDAMVITVDPGTCAIPEACAPCTQEVDFGRMNEARSSETVFTSQLADVVVNLATADCVTLDPAGRLVTSRVADDGTVTSGAIDSPLQNLAIYRQLMMTGYLGDAAAPIALPANVFDTAARSLGAASDKTGEVNVDLVAYLNQIMGLTDPGTSTILDKICIDMKQEVMGTVQMVEKCFLDYGNVGGSGTPYGYARNGNFSSLPAPAYISSAPGGVGIDGWFEVLTPRPTGVDPYYATFEIFRGPTLSQVFANAPGFTNGNIGGFAQAADDTRAVIEYMHSWPLPADFATPLVCEASGETGYDVSISEESGLQVPVQMVDGSEGREFIVTVANAGPDEATGSVTVNAAADNGALIYEVVLDDAGVYVPVEPLSAPPWSFAFTLAPGTSKSFAKSFSVDSGERTTITWAATAEALYDVNATNDTVTATTNIRVTGGGGGGRL